MRTAKAVLPTSGGAGDQQSERPRGVRVEEPACIVHLGLAADEQEPVRRQEPGDELSARHRINDRATAVFRLRLRPLVGGRRVGAGGGRIGPAGQTRIPGQDPPVQPLQRRAGVDPQLVGESPPGTLVLLQRLRLPPAPAQGQEQLLDHPLVERMRLGPGHQLTHHPIMLCQA